MKVQHRSIYTEIDYITVLGTYDIIGDHNLTYYEQLNLNIYFKNALVSQSSVSKKSVHYVDNFCYNFIAFTMPNRDMHTYYILEILFEFFNNGYFIYSKF